MQVMTGSVRYLFLRMTRGHEDIEHWPPTIKPLELPENTVCSSVRLYATNSGWRAECGTPAASSDAANGANEPPLIITRATVVGLLQGGKRSKAEVDVLGVRVVNLDNKGVEYASHFVVAALPGSGLGPRRPVVVPLDGLLLGDYVEFGTRAEVSLELRLSPSDYANKPQYMADPAILREARRTLDQSILSQRARHGITIEVEAGRIGMYGRAELVSFGDQATEALMRSPGVVEVADHLLYDEQLTDIVSAALVANGFNDIIALSEHGLINLRGEAPDSKSRYKAEDIAKGTPGVRGVVNDIVVPSAKVNPETEIVAQEETGATTSDAAPSKDASKDSSEGSKATATT